MRNYRSILVAFVFVFALSATVFADDGVIHTDLTSTTPPPPAASTTQTDPSDGIIQTGAPAPAPQTTGSLVEAALSVLQVLPLI